MNKLFSLILFIGFTFFSLQFFNSALVNYRVSQYGVEHFAEVIEIPNCGRSSNSMYVKFKNKKYLTEIGKNKCIQGEYQIGQNVKIIYSKDYDKIVMSGTTTNVSLYLSIAFFILPIASLYYLLKKK